MKGDPNQQLNNIPSCSSAAASYSPSNFPSPLPRLLMHPIIGASHDYGNGFYCNPAFFLLDDTSIQAMIVIHKGMGGLTLFIPNMLGHLIEMSHYERVILYVYIYLKMHTSFTNKIIVITIYRKWDTLWYVYNKQLIQA